MIFPALYNHFYNPLTGRAISIFGSPSPDWALEDHGEIGGQNDSFFDARKFLLGALIEEHKAVREGLFGRTFQALGQVIHHLQDMAQPQHVRHDAHLKFIPWFDLIPPENPSWYEDYTGGKKICETVDQLCSGFTPPVRFEKAREFWATADGRGLAQFTNTNFVTEGTNFHGSLEHIEPHPGLPTPNGENVTIEVKEVGDPELGQLHLPVDGPFLTQDSRPFDGKLYFIGTPVVETYLGGTAENPKTSTFSLYDELLEEYKLRICGGTGNPCAETAPVFTLNRFNFDAAHRFLIPKAISYSAGLIDYFFRGKVEMCDGESSDQSIIKNLSKTENMKGVFELYADDDNGVRTRLAQWATAEGLLPEEANVGLLPEEANGELAKNGGEMRVTFSPPDPKPDTYFLVFYGDMGEEKAPRDSNGHLLPGGAVVAKKVDTTKHCKGILWVVDESSSSVLAYHLPDGRTLGSFSLPNVFGVAYDPRDGNLWYTLTTGTNTIRKVTPTGEPLPDEVTVTGMVRDYQGYEPRILGIDSDPKDPSYLWVSTSRTFLNSSIASNYAYKVRTQDGPNGELAGQVVHQCRLVTDLLLNAYDALNYQVAVVRGGDTSFLLVSPFAASTRQRLHMQQVGESECPGVAAAEYFLSDDFLASGAIAGVDTSNNEVIAVVTPIESTDGTFIYSPQAVYHFGPVPSTAVLNTFPLPADLMVTDLAVGSSF